TRAQERDRLIYAIGGRLQPRAEREARTPAPATAIAVRAAPSERAQKPRAQSDEKRAKSRDERRYEREHSRTRARQDADENADAHQHECDEVRGARYDEEGDRAARDVAGRHTRLAERPDAEREATRAAGRQQRVRRQLGHGDVE